MPQVTSFEIKVTMVDLLDHHREEDIVKNLWPAFYPLFTRRHGVNKGRVILEDGAVEFEWWYTDTEDYETEQPKHNGRAIGGRARAASLSPERRSEIAKKAAAARWQRRSRRVPT